MRIAVDASALAGRGSGIARYLRSLLRRMARGNTHEWILYGRHPAPDFGGMRQRCDHLPVNIGRIASLMSSQTWWARDDGPDLFWGPAHRLPFALPARTARVVTIHDLCWREAPETMRRATRVLDGAFMPRALRNADRIIAVSEATRAGLARWMPGLGDRIVMVHEAAEALPSAGEPLVEPPYALFVGTIEPRKNLARLFHAFARAGGPHRLVVAGGSGWGTSSLPAMANDAGIADRLVWLGPVDDRTLATLYAHARCVVMPSLYEGFGLPLLEALAHGTPVLYGDNSSMPEVAGDAGVGVDATSVESIASGLQRLLAEHETFAARARAQAEKFSWDRAARETLAVFEEAIAARQARRA